MLYSSKVTEGQKLGRKLGFPTINLDPHVLPNSLKEGVYTCLIKYQNTFYKGALYFGPRLVLGETNRVLEINILDFNKEIYGQKVEFQIKKYLRAPLNFSNFDTLKTQLRKDIQQVNLTNFPH